MKCWFLLPALLFSLPQGFAQGERQPASIPGKVYVLPIREDVMSPMLYLVRRGVKTAMEAKADLLVLDMNTNGGRLDATEEIIKALQQFKGRTVTYVNEKAFSAGAFIAVATQKIFMAPGAVIGAAAPILLIPGAGAEKMPDTMEAKMTSAVRALVRASAEKNGHNIQVVEAMIDKSRELKMDGEVLNEKGQILTLTSTQAEKKYGNPPRPLLSAGTVTNLNDLLAQLDYQNAERFVLRPTGAEQLATWLTAISPLLLLLGIVGTWIEFKTPGFGLPGIIGLVSFAAYFFGGYVAGLSGLEWLALFILGLILVLLELLVFPGTLALGVAGAALMFFTLLMAMVDLYPGMPPFPTIGQVRLPLINLGIAFVGAGVMVWLLSRWLPKTSFYGTLISQSASGVVSVTAKAQEQAGRIGQVGQTISPLRPGGKAKFGQDIIDVISQGELIEKGRPVRIIAHSGPEAVVEPVS